MGPGYSVGYWFLLGHLKPGVTPQEAQADLTVIAERLAKENPEGLSGALQRAVSVAAG